MEKTITLVILLGLLIFVVGVLAYLFISYVKENIVLVRNLNWKIFGEILSWSPGFAIRCILFFIVGLLIAGWSVKEMLQNSGPDWKKTKATLSNVMLNERTVNKEPEQFLIVVYEFQVNGKTYEAYHDEPRDSFMPVEKQIQQVWSLYKTKDIFYDADNPYQTEFNERETGISMDISGLVTGFIFMLISYWLAIEAYKQKLADS